MCYWPFFIGSDHSDGTGFDLVIFLLAANRLCVYTRCRCNEFNWVVMSDQLPIMEARDLYKSFGQVHAVNGLSLQVYPGTCLGLLGPNGAGKTTTVEMLEGIKKPNSGEILFRGQPLGEDFRERAGIMFQSTALQEFITVHETLRMFHRFYENTLPLEEVIETFSLQSLLKRDTKKLSGGQKQRLLLAISLLNDPDVVFLDEPSTGLDPQARRNIWGMIDSVKQRGKTVVLTTHYMDEAYELCDDIAIVDQGAIIAQGSPDELLAEHFDDVVIELPHEDVKEVLEQLGGNVFRQKDRVQILTQDVDETVRKLLDLSIPMANLRIRSRNLEDLFLELTGKDLRV